ncbi:helix-turn-helix transcriptional regulator [Kitasatospora sp. NPDC058170]|uniref:helix-turn-helix transcriptional regulator n=1 Tax=Kitasatospora sp. NPDC058170 TaxID=3346364 RepID=UPI0036DAFD38
MRREDTEAVLVRLQELGMVTTAGGRAYSAADPESVVERLARLRIQGLQGEIRQVASSRHLVDDLLEDRWAGRQRSVRELERVEGIDQVLACVDELSFFTREERLTTHPGPILIAAFEEVRSSDLKYLRRGLRMRTILHARALDCPRVDHFAAELEQEGARVRGTAGVLERMVIFDRRTAVVATDPRDITRGALIVREPGLVSTLLALFERRWSQSCGVEEELPNEAERQVLHTMACVDKDETGARELGMSLRTYRSHVSALMRRLGTANRFQAALAARERSWI